MKFMELQELLERNLGIVLSFSVPRTWYLCAGGQRVELLSLLSN